MHSFEPKQLQSYRKPVLTRHENLKTITADWQCSAIDGHTHGQGPSRGRGHCQHGNGHGYGHYR